MGDLSVVSTRAALLMEDGSIKDSSATDMVRFDDVSAGSYFLVVEHRNHLGVMSAGSLAVPDGVATWDFRLDPTQAFSQGGSPLATLQGGQFGLFSCDINDDGQVTAADFNLWLVDTKSAATGYLLTDCNLDAQVTATDFNNWLVNTKSAAMSQVPN